MDIFSNEDEDILLVDYFVSNILIKMLDYQRDFNKVLLKIFN